MFQRRYLARKRTALHPKTVEELMELVLVDVVVPVILVIYLSINLPIKIPNRLALLLSDSVTVAPEQI